MRFLLFVLTLSISTFGCKTLNEDSESASDSTKQNRYEMMVQFKTIEDVKRVPYRLSNLRMEIQKEISDTDHIYLISVDCKSYEIDGIVLKLNDDAGVVSAKRTE